MLRVVQVGLGPIGKAIAQRIRRHPGMELVGAADPAHTGHDLGEVLGTQAAGVPVRKNVGEILDEGGADLVLHATGSFLDDRAGEFEGLLERGLSVVSTCEELAFPYYRHPELSRRLDAAASKHGSVLLGTGVNPGYLMDFLPTVLSGVCQDVKSIRVARVQDASVRRIPFQQKIGAALTLEEFEAKRKTGTLRHVGLPESVDFIAHRLGWKLDRNIETLEPVIAEVDIDTGYKPIAKGMACGVYQTGRGFVGETEVITLSFRAAVGEPESYEEIEIEGDPPVKSRIAGGINGDTATCAITLNTTPNIQKATPGLKTMAEIAPLGFFKAF